MSNMDTNGKNCDCMYGTIAMAVQPLLEMIRKSVPTTIVASLIIIVFRKLLSENANYQESILQILLVAIVTLGCALYLSSKESTGTIMMISARTTAKEKSCRTADTFPRAYGAAA